MDLAQLGALGGRVDTGTPARLHVTPSAVVHDGITALSQLTPPPLSTQLAGQQRNSVTASSIP